MDWKKRGLTFLLDGVLATLILTITYFARILLKTYINQIESFGPAIYDIQQKVIANESLTATNQAVFEQINSVMFNANLLNNFLLPGALIIAFIVTQMFVWKILNKTPLVRFVLYSLIPLFIFILFGSMFLEFLMWVFLISEFSFVWFIIIFILLIITSYYALLWNVHWKDNVKKLFRRKQVILPYLVLSLAGLFFLMMVTGGFIGFMVEAFSWWMILLILISMIAVNFARTFYIRKAKEEKK